MSWPGLAASSRPSKPWRAAGCWQVLLVQAASGQRCCAPRPALHLHLLPAAAAGRPDPWGAPDLRRSFGSLPLDSCSLPGPSLPTYRSPLPALTDPLHIHLLTDSTRPFTRGAQLPPAWHPPCCLQTPPCLQRCGRLAGRRAGGTWQSWSDVNHNRGGAKVHGRLLVLSLPLGQRASRALQPLVARLRLGRLRIVLHGSGWVKWQGGGVGLTCHTVSNLSVLAAPHLAGSGGSAARAAPHATRPPAGSW